MRGWVCRLGMISLALSGCGESGDLIGCETSRDCDASAMEACVVDLCTVVPNYTGAAIASAGTPFLLATEEGAPTSPCGITVRDNDGRDDPIDGWDGERGLPNQSAELALRFLCELYGVCGGANQPVGPAWQWLDNHQRHPALARLTPHPNGSLAPPRPGDLLVFGMSDAAPWGHVAVVTSVDRAEGTVYVAQQNCVDCADRYPLQIDGARSDVPGALGWLSYGVFPADCGDGAVVVTAPISGAEVLNTGRLRVAWRPALADVSVDVRVGRSGQDASLIRADVPNTGEAIVLLPGDLALADDYVACVDTDLGSACSAAFSVVDATACADADDDGWGAGAGCFGSDCDDANPDVHPETGELLNLIDDDCNGQVDEDFRVTYQTVHIGYWGSCDVGAGSSDHCLSTNGSTCIGSSPVPAPGARPSAPTVSMYDLSIATPATTNADGTVDLMGHTLARLAYCYNTDVQQHQYMLHTDPRLAPMLDDPDLRCDTTGVGYVAVDADPALGAVLFYEQYSSALNDFHYTPDHIDRSLGCYTVTPSWSAWVADGWQ